MNAARPRRLRATATLRDLVAETQLRADALILPLFVVSGSGITQPVPSLPGVARYSVDRLLQVVERAHALGIRAVMLFGVIDPDAKDADGSAASDPGGPVVRAIQQLRAAFGSELVIMTDVCLCGYTNHGHCGVLAAPRSGYTEARIASAATLPRLADMAVVHAEAGADVVAPSDMMDGRVAAIRQALDTHGHSDVSILAYAVKYASAFYGPFRDAAGSSPTDTGFEHPIPTDRRSYQMDPRNVREADLEVELDAQEGADLLMVKPALAYLDILARVRASSSLPLVAYQVSGEYAMLRAAADAGMLSYQDAMMESLVAMRRAGADLILTYGALDMLREGWIA